MLEFGSFVVVLSRKCYAPDTIMLLLQHTLCFTELLLETPVCQSTTPSVACTTSLTCTKTPVRTLLPSPSLTLPTPISTGISPHSSSLTLSHSLTLPSAFITCTSPHSHSDPLCQRRQDSSSQCISRRDPQGLQPHSGAALAGL